MIMVKKKKKEEKKQEKVWQNKVKRSTQLGLSTYYVHECEIIISVLESTLANLFPQPSFHGFFFNSAAMSLALILSDQESKRGNVPMGTV